MKIKDNDEIILIAITFSAKKIIFKVWDWYIGILEGENDILLLNIYLFIYLFIKMIHFYFLTT